MDGFYVVYLGSYHLIRKTVLITVKITIIPIAVMIVWIIGDF
tara:strand:- start:1940 stop:2065 length:126 start_codon:yes stop_codon:yes gene_type:complete